MPRRKLNVPELVSNPNDPQGMVVMLARYLEWMRTKNYSENTVNGFEGTLARFIVWAEERGVVRPNEVTKPIMERYQRYLYHLRKPNGDPLSFKTQACCLTALRSWFKWLSRNNHVLYNPASDLDMPRLGRRLPKHVLTVNEAEQIIAIPDVNTNAGIRDRAILETLYSTGIRRMEIINLSLYDVDYDRGTIMVRDGKGKKDRMVPIGERAIAWIERYHDEVRPILEAGDTEGHTLFLTDLGKPFRKDEMTAQVRQYVLAANTGKRGACHLWRHTAATVMHDAGADIRFIQIFLGHARLQTTEIYTQVSIRQLKAIHSACHPSSKLKREKDHGPDQHDRVE
jgi:integrase/recombinase XerD